MPYDLDIYLSKDRGILIPCVCDSCNKPFERDRRWVSTRYRTGQTVVYCGRECSHNSFKCKVNATCKQCNLIFDKHPSRLSDNNFCSSSCAATYNNTHKTKGTRRSKLEKWLELQLSIIYPKLEILYSDKKTINSELDIYIPSLNLAFELNGIFHYEPIYGNIKMKQIQNNDNRKFQACIENSIELCIIDTSNQKYFKESTSQKYLNIITHLVTSKLEASKPDYVEVV
jgi:hypothetical protein